MRCCHHSCDHMTVIITEDRDDIDECDNDEAIENDDNEDAGDDDEAIGRVRDG